MKKLLSLFMPLIFLACDNPYTFKTLPEGPVKHQLIVVAKTAHGIRAQGFPGATPPNMPVYFEVDRENKKLNANDDGSFIIDLPLKDPHASAAQLVFDNKIEQIYRIRDLSQALKSLSKTPFSLDGLSQDLAVDDIAVLPSKALLLSSNAALICPVSLDDTWVLDNKNSKSILLNPDANSALFPRSVAGKNNYALVSLMGSHELALVDLQNGTIKEKSRLNNPDGSLFLFDIDPPLKIKEAINADGSAMISKDIKRSFAHGPEKILALDDKTYLATFVNYYQFPDKAAKLDGVAGPGILALISIANDRIETQDIAVLPSKNPLFITQKNDNEIWLSCAGVYDINNKLTSTDAGLIKFSLSPDKKKLKQEKHMPLNDFVPAEPAFLNDMLLIPEAYGHRIARIKESDDALKAAHRINSPNPKWRFVFAAHWHADIFFLGEASGSLIAYSLKDGFLPFPFIEPIVLNPNQSKAVAFLPHKILFRHQQRALPLDKSYPPGFSAWVISQLQSKVTPLDLLEIFGPT